MTSFCRKEVVYELCVILFLLLPIFILFWPLIISPSDTYINGFFSQGHLWSWNLMAESILDNGQLVIETNAINYPIGGNITLIGWSFIIPLIPMMKLGIGLIFAVNILILLHIFLASYFAYRLALKLTRYRGTAIFAGITFAYSPFAISMLWSGQWPKLCYWLIPATLLLLIRIHEHGRIIDIILIGLSVGLALASSPYLGIVNLVFLGIALLCFYLQILRGKIEPATMKRLLGVKYSILLGVLPFAIYWLVSFYGQNNLLVPGGTSINNPNMDFHATFSDWFKPHDKPQMGLFKTTYIGWTLIILSFFSIFRIKKPGGYNTKPSIPFVIYFWVVAIVFILISFGPLYNFLPMYWIYKLCHYTQRFAVTYRVAVGVTLCMSILAIYGLVHLAKFFPFTRGRMYIIAFGVLGVFVAELAFLAPIDFNFPYKKVTIPTVYQDLAQISDNGAVMEVPCENHPSKKLVYVENLFLHQVWHQHPIVHRDKILNNTKMDPFLQKLSDVMNNQNIKEGKDSSGSLIVSFKYLVLNENLLTKESKKGIVKFLEEQLHLVEDYPQEGYRLYKAFPSERGMGNLSFNYK